MNNSIIAIDIIPAHDGKVVMYGAPDRDSTYRVSGKLRIVLSKSLKCKQVVIKLKGKAEYSDWENQYSAINILRLAQVLTEKSTLPSGVTDLDYEFTINGNLPQTYVTSYGLVHYKLVAIVQPSSLLAKGGQVEKSINIMRHYLPCKRELLPAPPTKVYRGQRKNLLKYELDIPTIVGVDEKGMLIRVRLLPLCERGRVKTITFDLVQSEKYKVQPTQQDLHEYGIEGPQALGHVQMSSSTSMKFKRSHPIKPTSLPISNEEDAWDNPLTYYLPFVQHNGSSRLKATIKSPLMRIRHKFRIIILFENDQEKKLQLPFPLICTAIPDNESDNHPVTRDSCLPSYDDVMLGLDRALTPDDDEADSSNLEGDRSASNSTPNSRAPSRSHSRAPSLSDSGTNTPTIYNNISPILDDNNNNNISNNNNNNNNNNDDNDDNDDNDNNSSFSRPASPDHISSGDKHLRHKRSQGRLAQALGRLLLRSDSGSRQAVSSSNGPTSPTLTTTVSNSSLPTLHITYSTTPTKQTYPATDFLQPLPSFSHSSNAHGSYLFTRPGRASWYLNMTDEEDQPIIGPEIHSAPSSPRESIHPNIEMPLPVGNDDLSAKRKSHRRSMSLDPTMSLPTTSTKTSLVPSNFGGILRRTSLTLTPNIINTFDIQMKQTSASSGVFISNDDENTEGYAVCAGT